MRNSGVATVFAAPLLQFLADPRSEHSQSRRAIATFARQSCTLRAAVWEVGFNITRTQGEDGCRENWGPVSEVGKKPVDATALKWAWERGAQRTLTLGCFPA